MAAMTPLSALRRGARDQELANVRTTRRRRGDPKQQSDRQEQRSATDAPSSHALRGAIEKNQKRVDDRGGVGRTAGKIEVDRKNAFEARRASIVSAGNSPRYGACADSHDPARLGHGLIGRLQRLEHGVRDRSGHQQQIGETRRWREEDSQAMEIIERIVERLQLGFAAVARAGVDMAHVQAAVKRALPIRRRARRDGSFAQRDRRGSRTPKAQSLEGAIAPVGQASVQSWQTTQRP